MQDFKVGYNQHWQQPCWKCSISE